MQQIQPEMQRAADKFNKDIGLEIVRRKDLKRYTILDGRYCRYEFMCGLLSETGMLYGERSTPIKVPDSEIKDILENEFYELILDVMYECLSSITPAGGPGELSYPGNIQKMYNAEIRYSKTGRAAVVIGLGEYRYYCHAKNRGWFAVDLMHPQILPIAKGLHKTYDSIHSYIDYEEHSTQSIGTCNFVHVKKKGNTVYIAATSASLLHDYEVVKTENKLIVYSKGYHVSGIFFNKKFTASISPSGLNLDLEVEDIEEDWWGRHSNGHTLSCFGLLTPHPYNKEVHYLLEAPAFIGECIWISNRITANKEVMFLKVQDAWVPINRHVEVAFLPKQAIEELQLYNSL